MSTPTYTLINQITLAAASSSVILSSIPQNYRDLILVSDVPTSSELINLWLNGDTSNHTQVVMYGYPSSFASYTDNFIRDASSGSGVRAFIYNIMDYSQIDKHKTVLARMNYSGSVVSANAGRWASNSAVTSLTMVRGGGGNFPIGSTFSLYGIVG